MISRLEIETEEGKVLELLRKQPVIPTRDFGEPVVGDHEGAGLRWGEMVEAYRRHLGEAQGTGGQHPAVARDYVVVAIDQDRDDEVEGLKAVSDLPDLLFTVPPRIGRIRPELVDRSVNNNQICGRFRAGIPFIPILLDIIIYF